MRETVGPIEVCTNTTPFSHTPKIANSSSPHTVQHINRKMEIISSVEMRLRGIAGKRKECSHRGDKVAFTRLISLLFKNNSSVIFSTLYSTQIYCRSGHNSIYINEVQLGEVSVRQKECNCEDGEMLEHY